MVTVLMIWGKSWPGQDREPTVRPVGIDAGNVRVAGRGRDGDVRLGHLARDAVVAVVEVTRVGGGDVEGDRVRAGREVGVEDRLAQVPKPVSPVLVTTKLGPPRAAMGENPEVLLSGPEPVLVMSVAVASTNGWPAGRAGRSAVKLAWPLASVVTLSEPRNVWPPPNSPGGAPANELSLRSESAKNSRRKFELGTLSSTPVTCVPVPEAATDPRIG